MIVSSGEWLQEFAIDLNHLCRLNPEGFPFRTRAGQVLNSFSAFHKAVLDTRFEKRGCDEFEEAEELLSRMSLEAACVLVDKEPAAHLKELRHLLRAFKKSFAKKAPKFVTAVPVIEESPLHYAQAARQWRDGNPDSPIYVLASRAMGTVLGAAVAAGSRTPILPVTLDPSMSLGETLAENILNQSEHVAFGVIDTGYSIVNWLASNEIDASRVHLFGPAHQSRYRLDLVSGRDAAAERASSLAPPV